MNEVTRSEQEGQVAEVKEKKVSRLAVLRSLLEEDAGYTKEELAEQTGLKLSTVNCQMYYHLPLKGLKVEKLEGKKFRFAE